ncbi:hypothetical protein DFH09DRAFT_1096880 [Mycena vulgaris]|nr:hypothetical protein DFH09DRAFT_1096880 [Mycena vulgaris]
MSYSCTVPREIGFWEGVSTGGGGRAACAGTGGRGRLSSLVVVHIRRTVVLGHSMDTQRLGRFGTHDVIARPTTHGRENRADGDPFSYRVKKPAHANPEHSHPPHRIYKAPPSAIVQHTHPGQALSRKPLPLGMRALDALRAAVCGRDPAASVGARAPGPSHTEASIHVARDETSRGLTSRARVQRRMSAQHTRHAPLDPNVTPPRWSYLNVNQPTTSTGRTRVREPHVAAPAAGRQDQHDIPLKEQNLYLDAIRPPPLEDVKHHHLCIFCRTVKSHPVSYKCGHSDCYFCVHLWLENKWTCPQCSDQITSAPFRHYGEEGSILHDYPAWVDRSRVSYSWEGLVLPLP